MGVSCSRETTAVDLRTPLLREESLSPVQSTTYPPLFSAIVPSRQNDNRDSPSSLRQPLLQSHNEAALPQQQTNDYSSEEVDAVNLDEGKGDISERLMDIYNIFTPRKRLDGLTIAHLSINQAHVDMHHFITDLELAHINLCDTLDQLVAQIDSSNPELLSDCQHNSDNRFQETDKIVEEINLIQFKLIDIRALFHRNFPVENYHAALKIHPEEQVERNLIRGVELIERHITKTEEQLEAVGLSVLAPSQRPGLS